MALTKIISLWTILTAVLLLFVSPLASQTIDEVYKQALKEEGGTKLLLFDRSDQRPEDLPGV